MKSYIVHSVKYLLKLVVLMAVLYGVLKLAGGARQESLLQVLGSTQGLLFMGLLVALAAAYPSFGFADKRFEADMDADRDKILRAFDMGGYELASRTEERMVFRTRSAWKRITTGLDDAMIVRREGEGIVVSGLRTEVVKFDYRLRSMLGE